MNGSDERDLPTRHLCGVERNKVHSDGITELRCVLSGIQIGLCVLPRALWLLRSQQFALGKISPSCLVWYSRLRQLLIRVMLGYAISVE